MKGMIEVGTGLEKGGFSRSYNNNRMGIQEIVGPGQDQE